MAVRTAAKRAYLQGEGTKRKEWGIHTVIVNQRSDTGAGGVCPECLPFVGKVFIDDVWSGGKEGEKDEDGEELPLLSDAIGAGLYHPRCRDSHTTYFPGISTPPSGKITKKDVQEAVETEKEEARQQYAERQAEKYERLADTMLDPENRRQCAARAEEWRDDSKKLKPEEPGGRATRNTGVEVEYNENASFSIVRDDWSKAVQEGMAKAMRDVAEKGVADGKEHLRLVDLRTGDWTYYETNGMSKDVGFDFWDYLDEHKNSNFAFVHNHNTNSSFSETDMRTLLTTEQIPIMIAVRNDGIIYCAERKGEVLPSDVWFDDLYQNDLKQLNQQVSDGTIPVAKRSSMREFMLVDNLIRDYTKAGELIEYDTRE